MRPAVLSVLSVLSVLLLACSSRKEGPVPVQKTGMIKGRLSESRAFRGLHPGLGAAFDFLNRAGLDTLAPGRHEIDGDRCFALVSEAPGRGRAAAPLEAHRRYIDVQMVISGEDEMGWRPLGRCREPEGEYDGAKDILFFRDAPALYERIPSGSFAVFFPEDAHAPLAGQGPVRKAVVKVAVEWGE
jgi:YhcH/YjgK/YiaL family protein